MIRNSASLTLYESPKRLNLTIMEQITRHTIYRDNGCWEFHGRCNQYGYGQIEYQGKEQLVTHIAWRIMRGKKVPAGKFMLHHCDNPRCYNPDHLFVGTQLDNMRDMIAKGRDNPFGLKTPTKIEAPTTKPYRRF